jgi:O-antigen/teichoic acid export membrane protein
MGGLAVLNLVVAGTQLVAGLGVGATAVRFVASFQSKGDYESMRKAGYECLLINAIATVIIAALAYLFANTLALFLLGTSARGNLFRLLVWEILALGVNYSLSNLAMGLRRFRAFSIISITSFVIRQGLVVTLLVLGYGLPGIIIGWGIGDSLNSALLLVLIRKVMGPFRIGFGAVKLLKFSVPLYFGEAAGYAWSWFDRALLLPLVSLSALGAYNVAVSAYGILDSLPGSISSTLFPYYSHFYKDGEASGTVDLEGAVKTASRYVSFFTIPLAVGLAATSLPAATLLAGTSYADSAYPLAVLSIFLAAACLLRALGATFIVLGKNVTSAMVTITSIIVPILLGALMVPYIGIIGGAIARGASLIIALIISTVILRRRMKLRFDLSAYGHTWVAAILMAVAVVAFEAVFYSKFLLPLYVVVGGVVFILCLRFLHAVKIEDLDLLSNFLGRRTRFIGNLLERVLGVRRSTVR